MLIRDFSSVNTRLAFDTNILMQYSENKNKTIKRKDLKVRCKLKTKKSGKIQK